jgi:hypothetical protein
MARGIPGESAIARMSQALEIRPKKMDRAWHLDRHQPHSRNA